MEEEIANVNRRTEELMKESSSIRKELVDWKRVQRDWEIQFNYTKQQLQMLQDDIDYLIVMMWDGPDHD